MRSLMSAYDKRSWVQTTWILVRVWKVCVLCVVCSVLCVVCCVFRVVLCCVFRVVCCVLCVVCCVFVCCVLYCVFVCCVLCGPLQGIVCKSFFSVHLLVHVQTRFL